MSSTRFKTVRHKLVQHCIACYTQGNTTGLQVLTAEDLINLERISGVEIRSERFVEKLVICTVCKLSLKFSTKFIEMCQQTQKVRLKSVKSIDSTTIKFEPEFLDIKIIQSINELLDWVDLAIGQLDQSNDSYHANESYQVEVFTDPDIEQYDDQVYEELVDCVKVEPDYVKSESPIEVEIETEIQSYRPHDIHIEETFDCQDCGIDMKTSQKLRKHRQKEHHVVEKERFVCDQCGSEFPSKMRLTYHLNGHFGIKPFVCSYEDCQKTFTNPSRLRNHTNEFHLKLIKAYCDICNRGFRTKAARDLHLKGHGEPSIPCEMCGKLFTTKKTLTQHLKIHTNIKDFKCEFCEKAFIKKSALQIHLRSHTKITPYICPECGMGFAYNVALRKHRAKVHEIDIKFYKKGDSYRTEPIRTSNFVG